MVILWMACLKAEDGGVVAPPVPGPQPDTVAALQQPAEAEDLDPASDRLQVELEAAPLAFTAGEGEVEGYAYNGQVPGPTLRATVGTTIVVDFTNHLEVPTTIHWHGLSVPAEMDGVTWLSDPLQPGESFRYEFIASRAGTFWYHPHMDVDQQVDLGLYGALVVEDPAEPAVDQDLLLVWDSWGEQEAATAEHSSPDPASLRWTVNGQVQPVLSLIRGERVRLRMLNVSNLGYLDLEGPALQQIAADQGLLSSMLQPESLVLAPGDRAELEWLAEQDHEIRTGRYTASGGVALGESLPLMSVKVEGPAQASAPLSWPFSGLPSSVDPGITDIVYVFSGGATGETWLINGESYPDVTVESLSLNQDAILEIRNLSATEHPFHMHGHSFEVLSIDGQVPPGRRVEDTINVGIRQVVRIKMLASNPGDWMVHCHLLQHEEGGMMTVLRVE